ncbi:hypothetical protein WSK_3805 [Novosphingobium sp. Rr 2-17]|uniref:hypothetical protein n=1 Tax=Novosphingobium sp. Rr 2-17 TaxID=555793 RepID=UPI00026988F5|nr:hypothetical protein [Novosphingobium sp. Rr 2-17]EIZ77794.1 hypothetical protein WSK_3805 [Novosphingobium sp. Rr 2-17]
MRQSPTPPQPQPPARAFLFVCSACETPECSPTPDLPKNWGAAPIGENTHAYCPECAIDLPKGELQ